MTRVLSRETQFTVEWRARMREHAAAGHLGEDTEAALGALSRITAINTGTVEHTDRLSSRNSGRSSAQVSPAPE